MPDLHPRHLLRREVLLALHADETLLTMLSEQIGERAMSMEGLSHLEIGREAILALLDTPMGRGA